MSFGKRKLVRRQKRYWPHIEIVVKVEIPKEVSEFLEVARAIKKQKPKARRKK